VERPQFQVVNGTHGLPRTRSFLVLSLWHDLGDVPILEKSLYLRTLAAELERISPVYAPVDPSSQQEALVW
jgi:hypothetical protein